MRAHLITVLVASALISGCAVPAHSLHYNYSEPLPSASLEIEIVDERPPAERLPEVLSYIVSSDKYGIYQLGDSQLTPDRLKYLSSQMKIRSEGTLVGQKLIVKRFVIYNNQQGALRSAALAAGVGGAVGAAMAGAFSKDSPYIETELKIQLGSQLLSSNNKANLIVRYKGQTIDEVISEGVKTTIDAAVDNVIKQMKGRPSAGGQLPQRAAETYARLR